MPIEPAVNWFSDYDINQPQDGDDLVEGDNHIRNLKKSILAQFPSLGDVAMTATAAELNVLDGILSTTAQLNLLQNISALSSNDDVIDNFPAGTEMLFHQASAPTGWTQNVAAGINDRALRVVNGAGAGTGGATAFTSVFGAGKNAGNTTLSTAQIPAHTHGAGTLTTDNHAQGDHTHGISSSTGAGGSSSTVTVRATGVSANLTASTNAGGGFTHNHAVTSGATATNVGGGSSHTHTLSLDLNYIDIIICAKD